ncbi:MAG: hypothetical protein F6K56_19505 [Moorea sp. SIO3G5]|nr:hypothetical protein [Moorena sp. SIO3G5]
MSEPTPKPDTSQINEWRRKIEIANRNNIFGHCRTCGYQWVDYSVDKTCRQCSSHDVERISCWQFPDD